ncbi:MAG: hypothetical protein ACK2U3_16735 [Anaerolineales bacterium]
MYTPRAGEATRRLLKENSREMKDKTLYAIQEIQESTKMTVEKSQRFIEGLSKEASAKFAKFRNIGIVSSLNDKEEPGM